ncbi:MAG: hypothetical protein R3F61_23845 [Myxococcota bacterium]
MNPYHYSAVRCRDAAVHGEYRNVGLLVVSPATKKVWLRRAPLKQRAHLVGDAAAFVKALLDLLLDEAREVVRAGDPAVTHAWMKQRALPSDDALNLAPPAIGIAADLEAEVQRLRVAYLGRGTGGGANMAEKLRKDVLQGMGVADAFAPRSFPSGPAVWQYPAVASLATGPLVFNALQFGQKAPETVLDAAFKNVGRLGELTHHHSGVRCLTVAAGPVAGPVGRAFHRAVEVMNDGGLNVVKPNAEAVETALRDFGFAGLDQARA